MHTADCKPSRWHDVRLQLTDRALDCCKLSVGLGTSYSSSVQSCRARSRPATKDIAKSTAVCSTDIARDWIFEQCLTYHHLHAKFVCCPSDAAISARARDTSRLVHCQAGKSDGSCCLHLALGTRYDSGSKGGWRGTSMMELWRRGSVCLEMRRVKRKEKITKE